VVFEFGTLLRILTNATIATRTMSASESQQRVSMPPPPVEGAATPGAAAKLSDGVPPPPLPKKLGSSADPSLVMTTPSFPPPLPDDDDVFRPETGTGFDVAFFAGLSAGFVHHPLARSSTWHDLPYGKLQNAKVWLYISFLERAPFAASHVFFSNSVGFRVHLCIRPHSLTNAERSEGLIDAVIRSTQVGEGDAVGIEDGANVTLPARRSSVPSDDDGNEDGFRVGYGAEVVESNR
jgi:hypothetical protein